MIPSIKDVMIAPFHVQTILENNPNMNLDSLVMSLLHVWILQSLFKNFLTLRSFLVSSKFSFVFS